MWENNNPKTINSEHSSQRGENGSKRSVREEDLQQTPKHKEATTITTDLEKDNDHRD